mmetsp:Transcript_25696/g.65360  ORF Transcript_25696/g.65360 Transcript_25696/m.65360 type:complete len:185 (-) Transcript_25696:77-631(-)
MPATFRSTRQTTSVEMSTPSCRVTGSARFLMSPATPPLSVTFHAQDTARLEKAKHSEKVTKHSGAYAGMGLRFVPIVTSTLGKLHSETVRFGTIVAVNIARQEAAFYNSGYKFERLVGMKVEWVFARMGVEIARGMALRACGIQYARHVPPPRARWLTQEDLAKGADWGELDVVGSQGSAAGAA